MSRKLQDLASQVIALRRPLDDAKTRAQVGMEGTARLQGQLRSVAEARDAAERECDAAKDECEVAARERDVAVWVLDAAVKSAEDTARECDAAWKQLQG